MITNTVQNQKSKENLYLLVMKGHCYLLLLLFLLITCDEGCIVKADVDYAIGYKNVKKSACKIALILSAEIYIII